jgi:triose/dihydroxyacetone kinase / FAD-AMP lyase (cyclizing)
MAAKAGRASYVPGAAVQEAAVPDPGAAAVAVWLQAVAASLQPSAA